MVRMHVLQLRKGRFVGRETEEGRKGGLTRRGGSRKVILETGRGLVNELGCAAAASR